jgi:uncharacterized protein YndB with AHSA1/START domain
MTKKEIVFLKDAANRKLTVLREFEAPVDTVWKAWTDASILDQWWAPKPWKAETKTIDFREGGIWLYCMVGPKGERHWCRVDYQQIDRGKAITTVSVFCDEEGSRNDEMPAMYWNLEFIPSYNGSTVRAEITFDREADMEMIIKMGFKEGFTMGLGNLEEYLKMQEVV